MKALRIVGALAAAAMSIASAAPARAQDTTITRGPHIKSEFELRSTLNVSAAQTRPQADLADNIGFGYGVNIGYQFRLDRAGIWSIRTDLGISDYGENTQHVPFPGTGRISLKVRTSNYIVPLSIGPQITWPTGSIRPYVNGGVGGQWFYTESHLEGENDDSFASTTNQHDFASAWTMGGGIYVPVVPKKADVMIDLGVQYIGGGRAEYLSKSSIVDLPDGQAQINPIRSNTHLLVVRLGAHIGM